MKGLAVRLGRDQRGAAAVELALIGSFFALGTMNASEVGRYAYQSSEVAAAAQAAAEAAYTSCDGAHTPATMNCPALAGALSTAIQGTSLASSVTLDGAVDEAYYCLNLAGALQNVGNAASKPSDCSAAHNPAATPALYLQVHVTYRYQPMFPGLTLAQSFAADIRRTSWMRMA